MIGAFTSYVIGSALAVVIGLFAAVAGFDREKGFYPTLLMVIAAYYVLFAVLAPDSIAMAWEVAGFLLFCTAAAIGFRGNPWIIVAGLYGHGLFDATHGLLFANPGAPGWWPSFCLSFDLTIGTWFGWISIRSGRATSWITKH